MAPLKEFDLSSDLLNMVHDYALEKSVLKLGTKGRLRAKAKNELTLELEKLAPHRVQQSLHAQVELLAEDFQNLIKSHFDLELKTISVFRRQAEPLDEDEENLDLEEKELLNESADDEELVAELKLANGESLELNLSGLGLEGISPQQSLIKEKPILSWILDSRSPFFNKEFSNQLLDLATVSSFRGLMFKNEELLSELCMVLGHVFVGEVH